MKFSSKYALGEIVKLKTDRENLDRMITQISFNPDLQPRYSLSCGSNDSWHYEIEILDSNSSKTNGEIKGFKINKS